MVKEMQAARSLKKGKKISRLMISSVVPAQLELDDLKMREWGGFLRRDVRISPEASDRLATTIYQDIVASDLADIFTLSDAISHAERFNALALFLNCIAERHLWKANALMNRAMLNLSNYMCLCISATLASFGCERLCREPALPDAAADI